MALRYAKVKKVVFQGNNPRSLVLRQRFAMKMLELLHSGKRILNIDETWISGMRYVYRKWKARGSTNSIPEKQV